MSDEADEDDDVDITDLVKSRFDALARIIVVNLCEDCRDKFEGGPPKLKGGNVNVPVGSIVWPEVGCEVLVVSFSHVLEYLSETLCDKCRDKIALLPSSMFLSEIPNNPLEQDYLR